MSILDEIKNLQMQGASEQEISSILYQRGFSQQEISNALSQFQIKNAINAPAGPMQNFEAPSPGYSSPTIEASQFPQTQQTPSGEIILSSMQKPMTEEYDSMQHSMLGQPQMMPETPSPLPEQSDASEILQQYPQQYPQNYDYNYQQYSYPPSTSPDTITEISEQVVSEKLSQIKKQLEKTLDLKTTFEAKISSIDERLQRIEKIIDRLQLSILQKVGEYTADVSDLKKELFETQKSFTSLSHNKTSPQLHSNEYHEHEHEHSHHGASSHEHKHPHAKHAHHKHKK